MTRMRQYSGDETSKSLSDWTKDPKSAERLAGSILQIDNYINIDPSHPLGGPDGLKDILCTKGNIEFVVAVYFPRTKQTFASILKKAKADFKGVKKNNVDGFIFFTNQHLTNTQKSKLIQELGNKNIELFHLERIVTLLNSPVGYGIRLEFLNIELSKTEQLSYFATRDKGVQVILKRVSDLIVKLDDTNFTAGVSNDKLQEFRDTLEVIVGDRNSFFTYGSSLIDRLQIPLNELKEFEEMLIRITGFHDNWFGYESENASLSKLTVPLEEIERFRTILYELVGDSVWFSYPPIDKLKVPIEDIEIYSGKLDEVIGKLNQIISLQQMITK
jgi:hypothetical protein